MKKLLLTSFLAILMANAAYAAPALIPGSTTVYWEITGSALHITGTGAMPDLGSQGNQPWAASRTDITQLIIADGITAIGSAAFSGCSELSGALVIPDKITSIGYYAFSGCSKLTSLSLPADLTSIGSYAFYQCSELSGALIIPDKVTTIGNEAFSACSKLTSLTLSADLTSIENFAFFACSELSGALLIPDKVTTIGESAFYACSKLTSLSLPADLTSIGNSAFYQCSELSGALVIPDKVTSIEGWAFSGCSKLTSLSLPADLTSIGNAAFSDCSELSGALLIPNKVTTIGSYIFYQCVKLISLSLSADLTEIGEAAFYNCNELSGALVIPNKVTSIGSSAFAGCSKLTSLTLPADLTSIADYAFAFCSELSGALIIPDKVTTIGPRAFQSCSKLTSLTLSAGLTSIADYAFYECSGITEITARSIAPPTLGSGALQYIPTGIPLYVPCQSQAVYEAAEGWNAFQVIPVGGVGVVPIHSADISMGTVEIMEMDCESFVATFRAVPKAGHRFVKWNDGNTDNPRSAVITAESSFTAEFAVVNHTITVLSNNETMGTVSGGGTYMETTTATLTANNKYSFRFVQWNDGNTDNPRYITVMQDATYTAEFAMDPLTTYYNITATSNNNNMGIVIGGGSYLHNHTATLAAIPNKGYYFEKWNDGSTNNPRYITATQHDSFTAEFVAYPFENQYNTIAVSSANAAMGAVAGGGSYLQNSTVTLGAIANQGYRFARWTDGNTNNPRSFTATENSSFTAEFEVVNGVEAVQAGTDISLYPNPASDKVYIRSALPVQSVMVIDTQGRTLIHQNNTQEINTSLLSSGIYVVKVSTQAGERVIKLRIRN